MAPAAFAKRTASFIDIPSARATASAPLNVSPAAVVSTGLTLKPGTSCFDFPVATYEPRDPKVMMTVLTPLRSNASAAFAHEASSVTLMPVSNSASVSFGVRIVIFLSSESGSFCAGAGFRMTVAFVALALVRRHVGVVPR